VAGGEVGVALVHGRSRAGSLGVVACQQLRMAAPRRRSRRDWIEDFWRVWRGMGENSAVGKSSSSSALLRNEGGRVAGASCSGRLRESPSLKQLAQHYRSGHRHLPSPLLPVFIYFASRFNQKKLLKNIHL
jgi:hypothetical protein